MRQPESANYTIEEPTATLRWLFRDNALPNPVLQQLFKIISSDQYGLKSLREEWREIPEEFSL